MVNDDEKKRVWLETHAGVMRLHGGQPDDAIKQANAAVDAFVAKCGGGKLEAAADVAIVAEKG